MFWHWSNDRFWWWGCCPRFNDWNNILHYAILSLHLLYFLTGRQIFYVGGLIFYAFSTGKRPVSLLQISLIQMKTWIASCCLWAVAILKPLLCISAGPLQDFRGCSIWRHNCLRFFNQLTTSRANVGTADPWGQPVSLLTLHYSEEVFPKLTSNAVLLSLHRCLSAPASILVENSGPT